MSRFGSIGLVMLMTSPVAAHHSPNMYDQQTNVSVGGTVTRYSWTNPHVYVYIEAPADTGELVERFELSADRRHLTFSFEHEDPEYLLEPVTGEMQWLYGPDIEFTPIACELDNAHIFVGD